MTTARVSLMLFCAAALWEQSSATGHIFNKFAALAQKKNPSTTLPPDHITIITIPTNIDTPTTLPTALTTDTFPDTTIDTDTNTPVETATDIDTNTADGMATDADTAIDTEIPEADADEDKAKTNGTDDASGTRALQYFKIYYDNENNNQVINEVPELEESVFAEDRGYRRSSSKNRQRNKKRRRKQQTKSKRSSQNKWKQQSRRQANQIKKQRIQNKRLRRIIKQLNARQKNAKPLKIRVRRVPNKVPIQQP